MSYAKLFSNITESSLWSGSKESRLLFVSMLARADGTGFIEAALPGLARLANLTLEETKQALAELMAPDPYSKTKTLEGRRVVEVDGGYTLVNYEDYRNRRSEDERREYMRNYMAERRKGKKTTTSTKVSRVNHGKALLAQGEGEGEGEGEADQKSPVGPSEAAAAATPLIDEMDIGKPTPPPLNPRQSRLGDLQAVIPELIVFRDGRDQAETLLALYGWDLSIEALTALQGVVHLKEPGKQRIMVDEWARWYKDRYRLTTEDYQRAGITPPPGTTSAHSNQHQG